MCRCGLTSIAVPFGTRELLMKLVDMDHTRSGRLRRAARFLKPSSLHGTYLQISRPLDSARQPKPSALVLNEPSCYHFRVFDPRLPLRASGVQT